MNAFDLLTDTDLKVLASALRSDRLNAQVAPIWVQCFCNSQHAPTVTVYLQQLFEEGMQPQHIALLAETIIRTRERSAQQSDTVELVWTGPETLGVTNRDTGVVVRNLFSEAETEVLAVGFAVHQGHTVFKSLADRMKERPDLRVRLFLDVQRHPTDTSLPSELVYQFVNKFRTKQWPGEKLPELYYDPRSLDLESEKRSSLHAKCIVIDRRVALVTSANFTEAAQLRNIEVGALIRCERFALRLVSHFETLTEAGLLRELPSSK